MKKTKLNNVFVLKAFLLEQEDAEVDVPKIDEFGCIKTHVEELGVFSSVKRAEKMAKDWLKHIEGWGELVFGFELTEKTVDESFCGKFNEVCLFKTIRTYHHDGSLNCVCECDSACEKKFKGRSSKTQCKSGNIVAVLDGNEVVLSLVVSVPMTKSEWKNKMHPNAVGDYTDDAYTVVQLGKCHSHPISSAVFPVFWKIPDDVKKKLHEKKKAYI